MRYTIECCLLIFVLFFLPTDVAAQYFTDKAGGLSPHENMQPSLGLNYIIATEGVYPSRNAPQPEGAALSSGTPLIGTVGLFAGNFAPSGWEFAEGQLLPIASNTALFSLLGTTYGGDGRTDFALPDLSARTSIHNGRGPGLTNRPLGQRSGASDVTLSESQLPSHSHTLDSLISTGNSGGSQPHNNMQPFTALNYLISLNGIYPTRNAPEAYASDTPTLAEVTMFAPNFNPQNFAKTDGQLLSVAQNDALFSLLGTTYGGDGRTTFGLPDIRGRAVVGTGTGPGLTPRNLGSKFGREQETLTLNQLPSHTHTIANGTLQNSGGGQSHDNEQPSIVLNYAIRLAGSYPSENGPGLNQEFIGEVTMFAGSFAPRNWAFAQGQLLPISSYQSLFSILGTTYGGDGRTTFALPDLRGRVPVHPDNTIRLGERTGQENVFLNTTQMANHNHTLGIPGDMNEDGYVDEVDLGLFVQQYGRTDSTSFVDGDFNGDGNTGVADLLLLKKYFTGPPPPAPNPVPEPSAMILFTLGTLGLLFYWRRK